MKHHARLNDLLNRKHAGLYLHQLPDHLREVADALEAMKSHLEAIHEPDLPPGHYLEQWREHAEICLEVYAVGSKVKLAGLRVRGADVTDLLREGLWEEAEAYCERVLGDEPTEGERHTVARMDAHDLRQARAA